METMRYPGSMWAQIRNPSDVFDEPNNEIIEGAIEQGVDWAQPGENLWLNSFMTIELKRDQDKLNWNQENKLSIGTQLRYTGIDRTLVALGAKHDRVKRIRSGDNKEGMTYFLNWHSYWDLAEIFGGSEAASSRLPLPGTTWGQLRYPAARFDEEKNSTLVEGSIQQGIDWYRPSENTRLNTFAQADYTFDSKRIDWNNKMNFGAGAKLKVFVGKGALLEIGAMYRRQHRFVSNRSNGDRVLFLNWSSSWDLGGFARNLFTKPQ